MLYRKDDSYVITDLAFTFYTRDELSKLFVPSNKPTEIGTRLVFF